MVHEMNHELLEALGRCAAECNHCATACLNEEEVNMLSRCIKLNLDCAAICQLSASFITRDSEHATHLLRECAEICEACAEECEKHAHMEHCRSCAEACHHCADLCMYVA